MSEDNKFIAKYVDKLSIEHFETIKQKIMLLTRVELLDEELKGTHEQLKLVMQERDDFLRERNEFATTINSETETKESLIDELTKTNARSSADANHLREQLKIKTTEFIELLQSSEQEREALLKQISELQDLVPTTVAKVKKAKKETVVTI
jgi:chromosome segregation ATPase